jgi:hypothetical protein
MSNITPGEWYSEDRGERIVILAPGANYEIASLEVDQSGACSRTNDTENVQADADLICAAPEMLALLRDLSDPVALACLDEYDPKLSKRVKQILKSLETS